MRGGRRLERGEYVQYLEDAGHREDDGQVAHQRVAIAPAEIPEQQRNHRRRQRQAGVEHGVQHREGRTGRRENGGAGDHAQGKRDDEVPSGLQLYTNVQWLVPHRGAEYPLASGCKGHCAQTRERESLGAIPCLFQAYE